MEKLSNDSLKRWLEKCPEDVRAFVLLGGESNSTNTGELLAALAVATPPQVPGLLRTDPDACMALGRIGRIRLLAWVSAQAGSQGGALVREIVGEDTEQDGGSGSAGSDTVALLFLEDFKEFARAVVGPRTANRMIDSQTLGVSAEAAVTLESDLAFGQGGV